MQNAQWIILGDQLLMQNPMELKDNCNLLMLILHLSSSISIKDLHEQEKEQLSLLVNATIYVISIFGLRN
jgi:hypothetical protein